MNTPISFLTAKLLKEKGFPLKNTGYAYNKNSELVDPCFSIWECEAPTIAEVVMWLYEKHGIWISVIDISPSHILWEYQISRKEVGLIYSSSQYPVKHNYSPTEAYEAAIEYTLNNLI